ncbi:MAG: hypothetical protein KatS3mg129_0436 [Leptospiraceae bacterium]|nr:MAG: hypothetical protein KatS3mg129_0436 [Leptospiraceae bacterium]
MLLKSISPDKYLSLLESFVYKQIFISLLENQLIVPYFLIEFKNLSIQPLRIKQKKISLNKIKQTYYKNLYLQLNEYYNLLFNAMKEKQSLIRIQFYLKEITLLCNQILLLENHFDIFDPTIGILKTPQLQYHSLKLDKYIKNLLLDFTIQAEMFFESKINTIKENHQRIFEYNLITKNCVTDLIQLITNYTNSKTLNTIFSNLYNSKNFSHITKGHFIPYFSYISLKKILKEQSISYKEIYYPSFRNELFLKNKLKPLKEISTITSKIYYFNQNDSFFLFFTERHIIIRPIFGFVNLLSSLGKTSYEILRLPYSIYENNISISKEVRGLFFSFTEIFFISIRKGTFLSNKLPEIYRVIFFQNPEPIYVLYK